MLMFIGKVNNYMFRPKVVIFRLSQLQFRSKNVFLYIYIYIYVCVCVCVLHSDVDIYWQSKQLHVSA